MSGGGGSAPSTTTTKVEYSPEEQAARNRVMQAALGTYDKTAAAGPGSYPGARPVQSSAETLQGQQQMLDYAGTMKENIGAAQTANTSALGAPDVERNQYLQKAMTAATAPLEHQFSDAGGTLSGIRTNAMQAGGFGGSRQGIAEGLAASRLQDTVGNTRATMASAAYDKGLDMQQAAIKNQAMLSMMGQLPAQITGQVGAQRDATAQGVENYAAAGRNYDQNSQWGPLTNLANLIYGGSNGSTTTNAQIPQPDTSGQTAGALASAAMMALMLL